MAVNVNPTSSDRQVEEKVNTRVEWTRSGIILAGAGLSFFLYGMWRVDGVMAAMGLGAMLLLPVARWMGVQNIKGLDLVYRGPRRVEVSRGFEAKLELHCGAKWLDAFYLEFGIRLLDEREVGGRVMWLSSNSSAMIVRWLSLKNRGLKKQQMGWVRSRFPLGLLQFHREVPVTAEIGVVPFGRIPKELSFTGFLLAGSPRGGSRRYGAMGEWKGLREWRSGDAIRKIAWAASIRSQASGGGLLVSQEEPPGSSAEKCAVVVHSYGTDRNMIRPDRFERSLSLLCGVASSLLSIGIPLRVVADFWDWEPMDVNSKKGLAALKERLLTVKRAGWTEAHNLLEAVATVKARECMILISDMPGSSWKDLIPEMAIQPVIVDIVNYEKQNKRKFITGKAGAK